MKSIRLIAFLFSLVVLLVAGLGVSAQSTTHSGLEQTTSETPTPDATDEMMLTEAASPTDEIAATEEVSSGDPLYTGKGNAQLTNILNPLNPAAGSGFVRFAHVSPDTGPIDIYLDNITEPLVINLQLGEYTGAVRLRSGTHRFTARAAGTSADSPILSEFDWNLTSNSTWIIAAVGRQADATLQLEPINVLRNFSQQVARLRIANVNPFLRGLRVSVVDGDSLADNLGWLGSFDLSLTVGVDAGTEEGMLNFVVRDVNRNIISEPVSMQIRPFIHYTILLTSTGDPNVVTPLIIPSTRDTTRVRFINERQEAIEILMMPAAVNLVPRLDGGETSDYFILASEAATFAAYAPGTGPNGQNLAGLPVQLEPEYDTTITFRANGTTEVTEKVFTSP
jgi:hypothetical protein